MTDQFGTFAMRILHSTGLTNLTDSQMKRYLYLTGAGPSLADHPEVLAAFANLTECYKAAGEFVKRFDERSGPALLSALGRHVLATWARWAARMPVGLNRLSQILATS